jgi:hypothetical protein
MMERLARDKHSSLLRKSVTYGRKKFYKIDTWCRRPRCRRRCRRRPTTRRPSLSSTRRVEVERSTDRVVGVLGCPVENVVNNLWL